MRKMFLKIKHKKLLKQMGELDISVFALDKYRRNVRGNIEESLKTSEKKIKRNFILGQETRSNTVRYGNLEIRHDGNFIFNIINHRGKNQGFNIDKKLKKELDIILDIE